MKLEMDKAGGVKVLFSGGENEFRCGLWRGIQNLADPLSTRRLRREPGLFPSIVSSHEFIFKSERAVQS